MNSFEVVTSERMADTELAAWHAHVRRMRGRHNRKLYGPKAPQRKRRRRVQRKIDARNGAMYFRNRAAHGLRVMMLNWIA